MGIPLFQEIERLIVERGSSAVMRQQNEFLLQRLTMLKDDFAKLEKENSDLKQRIAELGAASAARSVAEAFTEYRGALFKKRPGGGYEYAVYCHRCQASTSAWPDDSEVFSCTCGWCSSFRGNQLAAVIAELP